MMTLWGEDDSIETRICSECRTEKPLSEFAMDTTYVRSKCKKCKKQHTKIANLLKKQHPKPSKDYACPICGDTEKSMKEKGYVRTSWCLDHDHETNHFRGYICHLCNTAISNFQENPEILKRALKYLTLTDHCGIITQ